MQLLVTGATGKVGVAVSEQILGRCQGNGGSAERGARQPLGSGDLRCKRAPLRQCGGASLFVNLPGDEGMTRTTSGPAGLILSPRKQAGDMTAPTTIATQHKSP
jgi:hypothetical protein